MKKLIGIGLFSILTISAIALFAGHNGNSKSNCLKENSYKNCEKANCTKKNCDKKSSVNESEIKSTVQKFYDALSTKPTENSAAEIAKWMDSEWNSTPTPPGGPKLEGFVKTLNMFHGMIPDLNWEVKEMLIDGNRVTVRSIATGTPNSPEGHFFGVPTDGSKSFKIQTIDIHTVENGKMTIGFHTEDWASAIQQVTTTND